MIRLPRDVENSFEEVHIQKIWNVLEEKFSFNIKGWKEEFTKYLNSQSREISERQAFIEFGLKKIQPLLNGILKRTDYHPTWINLMRWVVKNK
jgi:hypothetical protein